MLLSRFWYVILALLAAAGFTFTFLAYGAFNRKSDAALKDSLIRDRVESELILKIDARSRLDAIAPIALDGDVRKALSEASAKDEVRIDAELGKRLARLNKQLKGQEADYFYAVDAQGRIVGQVGGQALPDGAGLGALPAVARALAGYVRDDTWVLDGELVRVAARPVINNGRYVGALVHAKKFDETFAQKLSDALSGATVAFFIGEKLLAGHMPDVEGSLRPQTVLEGLAGASRSESFKESGVSEPVAATDDGLALYSDMVGSASSAGAVYAIARPRVVLGPWDVFSQVRTDDKLGSIWILIIGGAILAALIGLLALWIERDRPLGRLLKSIGTIRGMDRLTVGSFGGKYRKVATAINDAVDRIASEGGAALPRKAKDLDKLLDGADGPKTGPAFGFAASDEANGARKSEVETAKTPGVSNGDDAHFRQTFDAFVAEKQRCGEDISKLTFDRFARSLEKNRHQIMSMPGVKGVRFTVYEKNGKAAIKANPVR